MSMLGNASNSLQGQPPFHYETNMLMAVEGRGGEEEEEEEEEHILVARNVKRSVVWEYFQFFTHRTAGEKNGKRKGRCKKCKRVLAADTRNGTSRLIRHAEKCYQLEMARRPRAGPALPPSHPDEHEPNHQHQHQLVVTACSESLSNNMATLSFRDDDPGLQPIMLLLSQSQYQPSPTPSFFENLPVPAPPPACDPPPPPLSSVLPQAETETSPPPPPPSSQESDEGGSLAREHGLHHREEDEDESSNQDLARLIALKGYDPALLEDDCFRSFVARLNPGFKFPSRRAVEEMCDGIFDEAREDLRSRLRGSHGKVSLAIGKTKTMHGEALYTACHFIDDEWKLHQVVHDAYLMSRFSIFYGPLLGVPEATLTGDDTEAKFSKEAFKDIWLSLLETDGDMVKRTFVVVWGIQDLQMIKSMKRVVTDFAFFLDGVLGQTASRPFLFNAAFTRKIYEQVHGMAMTREKRQQLFSQMGLDHLLAQDDYWYSCYCSLEFLRQHGSCTIEGKDYSQYIELMCRVWGVIYRGIQTVSTSTCPTANQYLVELFNVREILQSELERIGVGADDSIVYPGHSDVFIEEADDVADIITKAKNNLDETMENFYLQWSAPLVVDPRYKLDHIKSIFRKAFGSEGARKVSNVRKYISKLYADYIEYDSGINSEDSESDGDNSGDGMSVAGSYLDPGKELDLYLNDPRVVEATQDFDILNWWKVNSSKYPTVARMARDVLAMPTCSKLSSEQMAHVNSIVRGYSKKKYRQAKYEP